ncbi:hypothetical protein ACMD2_27104 [Ananas comosus]|uniref:Uncharacterized protein n=1 Tax=Ananas comosus TaxID=4615 RepID=A0A199VDQ1_ANACO|nr:hypothetical protein ACMD2_27104 [Ananas comosus]
MRGDERSERHFYVFILGMVSGQVWWYCAGARQIPFMGNAVLSDVVACAMELASWVYRTAIFLLTCVLFRLICYLQRLRLHDFAAVHFVEHVEAEAVLREHLDIRRQLKIISHRFRGFIVACLLTVTASQFASVLLITRKQSQDNLFNTGELALCSIVLVTGFLTCLHSAAKITHHAQALTSHATKWHACCTIDSFEEVEPNGSFVRVIPAANPSSLLPEYTVNEDESPEDTADDDDDNDDLLEDTKLVHPHAHTISFQKRQALVTYLENNKAGITVYGYTLDRTWLNAIFMVEWTLFLWLLGKTIGVS